jgi:hypothetical protein
MQAQRAREGTEGRSTRGTRTAPGVSTSLGGTTAAMYVPPRVAATP